MYKTEIFISELLTGNGQCLRPYRGVSSSPAISCPSRYGSTIVNSYIDTQDSTTFAWGFDIAADDSTTFAWGFDIVADDTK
jgi:hypothetical protein